MGGKLCKSYPLLNLNVQNLSFKGTNLHHSEGHLSVGGKLCKIYPRKIFMH